MSRSDPERFLIRGMDCADCAQTIERKLRGLPGVESAVVAYSTATARVTYRPGGATREQVVGAIREAGYDVAEAQRPEAAVLARPEVRRTIAAAVLAAVGWVVQTWGGVEVVGEVLLALAAAVGGIPIARRGWSALRASRTLDMNVLMTIAVIGAAAIDRWEEAAAVVVLFSLAEMLETLTADRARSAVAALIRLAPQSVLVRRHGGEMVIPSEAILAGDVAIVRPGERIPVDGIVQTGHSSVVTRPRSPASHSRSRRDRAIRSWGDR